MRYRHEWKHEINYSDMLMLRKRLSLMLSRDAHAQNGKYKIRSLYFDDLDDSALKDKLNGINHREKFRIRCYNDDTSFIRLEKKVKHNNLGYKLSAPLSVDDVGRILDCETKELAKSENALVRELCEKIETAFLRPKTIVEYTREPFVYAPGNVRVTLDYDIRTGIKCTDFLNMDCVTVPIKDNAAILEVKWDEFLPDIIKSIVVIEGRRTAAYSKYASCRMYE